MDNIVKEIMLKYEHYFTSKSDEEMKKGVEITVKCMLEFARLACEEQKKEIGKNLTGVIHDDFIKDYVNNSKNICEL